MNVTDQRQLMQARVIAVSRLGVTREMPLLTRPWPI